MTTFVLADTFSELGHTLLRHVERLPHGHDAASAYFHFFSYTNPALIILPLAACGLLFMTARRWGKQTLLAGVLALLASFFVLASGRAVVRAAISLHTSDRPSCIADAIIHGAVWDSKQLKNTPSCNPPSANQQKARPIVDSGKDGTLAGTLDSDTWSASVSTQAPNANWQARSIDKAGTRSVYLESTTLAFKVAACPDVSSPQAGKDSRADHSGALTVTHFAQLADRSQFPAFVTRSTRSVVPTGSPKIYRFVDQDGLTTGYLLPASGDLGECVILTGPYLPRSLSLIPHPSAAALALEGRLAETTDVIEVHSAT